MYFFNLPFSLKKALIKALSNSIFSLPMHTELDDEQLQFITQSVLEFINK